MLFHGVRAILWFYSLFSATNTDGPVSYSECSQNKNFAFALRVACYGFRVACCALRIALYALRVTYCALRVTFYALRVAHYVLCLRVTACALDLVDSQHSSCDVTFGMEGSGQTDLEVLFLPEDKIEAKSRQNQDK